ncbi:MAG: hypothetical protein ACXACX_15335 [Candidatus Hodarchaeales archaeon]
MDSGSYKLSFGTENSKDTLLGYSDSLISELIYSSINPLDHVAWNVYENDTFISVKHVLVDDDIVIMNPIAYTTYATLDLDHLYDRGFGLEDYIYEKEIYYYNSSNEKVLLSEFDYVINESGIVSFPDISIVHELYDNRSSIVDDSIYFEYYIASEVYDQLLLSNADGFFINFTLPSVYYDHTTIEKLTVSFNDVFGNSFPIHFYDVDLREFFLDNVKSEYEVDIFGLGKMMTIPLYIDMVDIQLSNLFQQFDIRMLESIAFTIADSERWPGSFIQEIGEYSVLNLPYQRVGISNLTLYNSISDSIEVDESGYVQSTVMFTSSEYYDLFAEDTFNIKRLDIEFTDVKIYANNDEITLDSTVDIEYSDYVELNYRWNNTLSPVLLNNIYKLPITLNNVSSGEIVSLQSLAYWVTKIDVDSLAGYLTNYYYSRFQAPKILAEFNVTLGSLGTPIFNISFVNSPTFILNVTQESLLADEPIYISKDIYELEYGQSLFLDGVIRDNDEYVIEDEVYNYYYQEALDGKTVHHLDFNSPFGDETFINYEEFAIYYVNNNLEKVPLYSTLNGGFYKDHSILDYTKDPIISYVDNAFLLNIFWAENATNFIDYDTLLLISYKIIKGKPISPLSYSSVDSYGNDQEHNLIEVPFARYDMLTSEWVTEDDFIEHFIVDRRLLFKDVESGSVIIQGPQYNETQVVQTGIVDIGYVKVNKSYSEKFITLNESEYSWDITSTGTLNITNLNYSSGDVFRVWYYAYFPTSITHPLNSTSSQISYLKITNNTGYEYEFTLDQDYTLSDDGYTLYFLDLYNSILKSGNFSRFDAFEIKYHAPLARKVNLGSTLILTLQDSEGNHIPIDSINIDTQGFFEYTRPLRLRYPFEITTPLSIPLGGGKKLVHMTLAYLPVSVYNKSSDEFVDMDYEDESGNKVYPYAESTKWVKPFTIVSIPDKRKLELVEDLSQNIAITQDFINEREYQFNYNPTEMLESGEEYSRVLIDALVREEYEFTFRLQNYEDELDKGTPINNSIVWLHVGLLPKSKDKFLNTRAFVDEYGINPYFESLGTEEVTFLGPGLGPDKMFGRPLTYELDTFNTNYSAYGPYIWAYGVTNELGEVTFDVSLDQEYLEAFMDIFGSVEGINSIEDVVLYIRAFSSHFDWDAFAIDTPSEYICSKDGMVYDGSNSISNYDFTDLKLQDSTYVEGLITLHKDYITVGSNDYLSYTLPDGDLNTYFDPITVHLYASEAKPISMNEYSRYEAVTRDYLLSELEPTYENIFEDNYTYYATINFVNPSGNVIESLYKQIHESAGSGYFTIDNETVASIMNELVTTGGPGISSIQIQIAESDYYKASPALSFPIEIKAANWLKFGEKNTQIDLLDPFINAYGSVFDGEEDAPFESSYPHLIGTIWVEPDFWGDEEEKEQSIQDYIEISLIASVLDEDGYETNFPLRESVMLRPGNRDGIMKFDVGLGPEDAFLMDLICSLNLSFSIGFNEEGIYADDRDVTIYLLDLRLESNPSSSTPDTIWSLYHNQTKSSLDDLEISKDLSFDTVNSDLILGGTMNGELYGINYEFVYDNETVQYAIDSVNELLGLFNLSKIEPLKIIGRQGGFDHIFTDWSAPYPASESLMNQSMVQFNSDLPDAFTQFTVIYEFTFDFNDDKHYGKIQLGPDLGNEVNESWIAFDLKDGFLARDVHNSSFMYVRYNQSFKGDGNTKIFTLNYTIDSVPAFNSNYFIIYNEDQLNKIDVKDLNNGYPRITFKDAPASDVVFDIVYGVRSQYELGYGFQKVNKSFSDSVRLIHNNEDSSIKPIEDSSGTISSISVEDPSLYIGFDNSPAETVLELYDIPLLYDPEVNLTFKLDPIIVNQIENLPDENNSLAIDFHYVLTDYNTYFTDSIIIPLNYTEIAPDLESDTYTVFYNKDLQGIYESFGSTSLDIYISFSQISNTSFIPYIILEQFDYLCDAHLVEMYSQMPKDENNELDVSAVITTPHYFQIFSKPFIDGTGYGESPFDLMDGSEITVGLEDLPYSKLVSLEGVVGDFSFNDLGNNETLAINAENFYMIPNMGLFTEGYDIDSPVYQDGYVNLYYGSGTEVSGEHWYSHQIVMEYESSEIDDYESWISSGVSTSWEDVYNITDQFLTTQEIEVSGTVLYHQLFDLTDDILSNTELETILGDISGMYFGFELPEDVYPSDIKVVGTPYEYDLSVQGFPVGDYVDGTYCKVITSSRTRNYDMRNPDKLLNTADYSLEFALNGSNYIVFYQPSSTVQTYATDDKIMVDYWASHTFTEGFDYNIVEDPEDPFVTVIDWDYTIISLNSYSMHPDFAQSSSFTIEYAALDWSSVDNNYIFDGEDEFTFRPDTLTNITTLYVGEEADEFSIYGIIPEDQFNDTGVYQDVHVQIWQNQDESTIETYQFYTDPISNEYIYQSETEDYYYWINYTKIESDIQQNKGDSSWTLTPDSYVFVEVEFVSELLRYPLSHTPFNYDYVGTEHSAFHIKLTIGEETPIYSNDTSEFDKYILKIEDNYIYFQDRNFTEEGYIANNTEIKIEYKFKLQPGLLDQENFLMAIYPWTNAFDNVLQAGDGSMSYRERYRKLSGSSIIAPFEYSLSINDTYSLFLSYRLNRREYFEEKFEYDYTTGNLDFYYLQDGLDSYVSELEDSDVTIYYYDENGEAVELHGSCYTVDTTSHKVTLHHGELIIYGTYPFSWGERIFNPIIQPNEITEFFVSFFAQPYDGRFKSHTFTYIDGENLEASLEVKYWSVVGGERLDVMPNFDAYYYCDLDETTYDLTTCRASQINAYLEEEQTLSFDLEGELSWYDSGLLQNIRDGDTYLALYMNTVIENYEVLEKILIELYKEVEGDPVLISSFNMSIEDNGLKRIDFTPIFRSDAEFSSNNAIGVPQFEFIEWDETKTSYNEDGLKIMYHVLENPLYTDGTIYEIAYLFNGDLEYLELPEGVDFDWTEEEIATGEKKYILKIPEEFINPDDPSEVSTFREGDAIMIRYNSPVDKTIQLAIEELFFRKKPYNYDTFSEVAEILLINTNNTLNFDQFTTPYSYNISIPITPFNTEYLGNYKQFTLDLDLATLSEFAENDYIDFSNIVMSVPNPAYELTIEEIAIYENSIAGYAHNEVFSERVWRYTEKEEFISGLDPASDSYQLALENKPMFYYDSEQGKWLEYLTIYDADGNYYSAGLQGDENQLLWNATTGNFTWNNAFDQFQDYWGVEFELPMIIEPDARLYFEYSTNSSWEDSLTFDYENVDAGTMQIIYDYDYLLKPRYYTHFDTIFENDEYDYEFEQFYAESFTVYTESADYSLIFDIEYDLEQALYSVVALYPNYTQVDIEDDDINYDITFDFATKNVTINDLNSGDGVLNQFDSITVILNFTLGPVSTLTQVNLTSYFNQTFITDMEETFYDEIYGTFEYFDESPMYLLNEDYVTLTSAQTSFNSINFTRNPHLGNSPILKGYNEYEVYLNFEVSEDQFNTIYEADINLDGAVDYKQEIDIDKDGKVDITKYGIEDPENPSQVIWYRIIQDFETVSKTIKKKYEQSATEWFDIDDAKLVGIVNTEVDLMGGEQEANIDLWGERIANRYTLLEQTQYSKYYSIRLDDDLDGYADSVVEYTQETNVVEYTIDAEHETLIGERILSLIEDFGYSVKDILDMTYSQFQADVPEWASILAWDYDGHYYDDLDETYYTSKFNTLQSFSAVYLETLHLDYRSSETEEILTYYDLDKGEVVETRSYEDKFVDDKSLFISEEDIESYSILNLENGQQIDATNVLINASHLDWSTNTWGIDNIPNKYETVITTQGDSVSVSNLNEQTVIINIDNRYSLFYDYLQTISNEVKNEGTTTFIVTGVFITPSDGLVYFTSEKDAFGETSNHDKAKTTGHYLYYDSDLDGFYETVYILAPSRDNIYDVISIGFNYDGSHDFIPYVLMQMSNELFGTKHFSGEVSTVAYKDNWRMSLDVIAAVDALYPKDLSDGYGPKDQIFEIYRLEPSTFELNRQLYYDVYYKEYGEAYNSYRENLLEDIVIQVGTTVIAGVSAALVGILASWLTPFVFAGMYFLLTWANSETKKREMKNRQTSRTYYSTNTGPTKPHSLNKMRTIDVAQEGIPSANNGHPGAYYSKVYGGTYDDMYEADIIASPPSSWRIDPNPVSQDWSEEWAEIPHLLPGAGDFIFNNFNLDYFMVSSELPALPDTLNSMYSSGSSSFYSISLGVGDRIRLYDAFKTNTIGYAEQEVKEQSQLDDEDYSQFDTIRPYCINGVPQYKFINSQDEVQTFSPLYSPLVLSQYRYNELVRDGKYSDSIMTIDVDCAYGDYHYGDAFNAYQLDPEEVEVYKAKIPLSPNEFNYPVTNIIIDAKVSIIQPGQTYESVVKSIDVDPSDYIVEDGNLYFYRTLEEIVFTSRDEWWDLASFLFVFHYNIDYDVHVSFATVVPYSEDTEDTQVSGGINIDLSQHSWYLDPMNELGSQTYEISSVFTPEIIDTSNNDLARTALAQTTSYAISDYFNQYYMGYTDGTNEAERDYTVLVTFWSTLISNLILLPISAAISSFRAADVAFKQITKSMAVETIKGVVSEVFEELYIDPYIEGWIKAWFYEAGGDLEVANLLSMIVTSLREAASGGASGIINAYKARRVKSNVNLNVEGSTASQLANRKAEIAQQIGDLDSRSLLKSIKSALGFVGGIALSIPAFFLGGASIATMSIALDLSTDIVVGKMQNYYRMQYLGKQYMGVTTLQILEAVKSQNPDPGIDISAINNAPLFAPPKVGTIALARSDSDLMRKSYGYSEPQLAYGPFFEFDEEFNKERHEKVESNLQVINELKVNSESDSDEFLVKNDERRTGSYPLIDLLETGKYDAIHPDREMTVSELMEELYWESSYFGILVNGKKGTLDMKITPNDAVVILPYIMGGAGKQGLVASIQNIFNGELDKHSRRTFHNIKQFSWYISKDGNPDFLDNFINDKGTHSNDVLKEVTELMFNIYHVDSIFSLKDRSTLNKLKSDAIKECVKFLKIDVKYKFNSKTEFLYNKLIQEAFDKGIASKLKDFEVLGILCDLISNYENFNGLSDTINNLQDYLLIKNNDNPTILIKQLIQSIWGRSYHWIINDRLNNLNYFKLNDFDSDVVEILKSKNIIKAYDRVVGNTRCFSTIRKANSILYDPGRHDIWLAMGDFRYGLAHILLQHEQDFLKLSNKLNSQVKISEFIFDRIKTQTGVVMNEIGRLVYAFRLEGSSDLYFLVVAIDGRNGKDIGRIHTAFPVHPGTENYNNYFNYFINHPQFIENDLKIN